MKRYRVQINDSLPYLSKKFEIPVCMIIRANMKKERGYRFYLKPGREISIPEPDFCYNMNKGSYTVKEGDMLITLSERYGIPMRKIMRDNNLKDTKLKPSMQLRLIKPKDCFMVKVNAGESLADIAEKYGDDVAEIMHRNDMNPSRPIIYPGMQLLIRLKR